MYPFQSQVICESVSITNPVFTLVCDCLEDGGETCYDAGEEQKEIQMGLSEVCEGQVTFVKDPSAQVTFGNNSVSDECSFLNISIIYRVCLLLPPFFFFLLLTPPPELVCCPLRPPSSLFQMGRAKVCTPPFCPSYFIFYLLSLPLSFLISSLSLTESVVWLSTKMKLQLERCWVMVWC